MTTVVVTEKAIREMVREAMWNKEFAGWSSNSEGAVEVNGEVDSSAAATDPINPNFTPQTKVEFGTAIDQLVKDLPNTDMPKLYKAVKAAVEDNEEDKDEKAMHTKAVQSGTKQVEEAVRRAIRRILVEELPPVKKIPFGVHGKEYADRLEKNKSALRRSLGPAIDAVENPKKAADDDEEEAPKRTYKDTALGNMQDVGGTSFEQIANELGFSVAGAKQAVDKALEKARWLAQEIDEEDREILVLTAMNDYIKYLSKSGELSAGDIQLMKDHPDMVRELDGFREYLHNHVRKARKEDQKLLNPIKDDDEVEVLDDDEVEGTEETGEDVSDEEADAILGGESDEEVEGTEETGEDVSDEEADAILGGESDEEEPVTLRRGGEEEPATMKRPVLAAQAPTAKPAQARGGNKTTYKIYPGGKRFDGKPVHTRLKGQAYAPSGQTQFKPGEQGVLSVDNGKLKVKKPDSDHTQTWDPVDESARPILYLDDASASKRTR